MSSAAKVFVVDDEPQPASSTLLYVHVSSCCVAMCRATCRSVSCTLWMGAAVALRPRRRHVHHFAFVSPKLCSCVCLCQTELCVKVAETLALCHALTGQRTVPTIHVMLCI
jgi:hypothetical protein